MKRIRKVAGVARDLDVLAFRYSQYDAPKHKRLLRRLKQLRQKSQRSITELNSRLISNCRLKRRESKLLDSIDRDSELTLDAFAIAMVRDQAERLLIDARSDLDDVRRLHEFRIQAKEFRYVIELLSDVLPGKVRSLIYPVVCKTQDVLGEVNDHATAIDRLRRLGNQEKKRSAARRFKKLCKKEKSEMEQKKRSFRKWWNKRFTKEFDSMLKDILRDPKGS